MTQTLPVLEDPPEGNPLGAAQPVPVPSESPTAYADRVGAWYVSRQSTQRRKAQGLYLTSVGVAQYMAGRIEVRAPRLRLLDPAAGAGVLCCAVVEALVNRAAEETGTKPAHVEIVAHEADEDLLAPLRAVLAYLTDWARQRGLAVAVDVSGEDFLRACSAGLGANVALFAADPPALFDVVVANPPYFKIAKDDPRARALAEIVHGQPNIYAFFMAVAARLLRPEGRFVFITPRSFASGPYFRRFRGAFFRLIQPTEVHVFRSRRDAFRRDDVLQENVILCGVRRDRWAQAADAAQLLVTSSDGKDDMGQPGKCIVPMKRALDLSSADKVLRLPTCGADEAVVEVVDAWPSSLQAFGLNISTGPVVPFRAAKYICDAGEVPQTHAPLLWMNHVQPLRTTWPLARHKPEYIAHEDTGALLLPNKNYVLIRRFSAKEEPRRLTAAPHLANTLHAPVVGLENHLNYIHRPGGDLTEDEAWGLATLYSSRLLDRYFRTINGNTQVSATELRTMPLPAHDVIVNLGRQIRQLPDPLATLDQHVLRLLVPGSHGGTSVGFD